jgi:uroporphyrinogen decarboxylase
MPAAADPVVPSHADPLANSRFLRACRREPVDARPVWIMRQAGRYLPEYMDVRRQVTFIELCKRPDLAAEVTLSAQRVLGVDAAILFADLLPILEPMGMDLEYAQGEGPIIHNPVKTAAEVSRVKAIEDQSVLGFVFEAVKLIRRDLPAHIPLLGFAGAPFTLASYIIEGSGSRNYQATKTLMYTDRGAWNDLMDKLTRSLIGYLREQIAAGCQAVQLFDSWAGCLSPADYREFVEPWSKRVIDGVPAGTPVIHFLTGNPALLGRCAAAGGSVIGIDWRIDLETAWGVVGHDRAVQGNLDPLTLFADWPVIRERAEAICRSTGGRAGHIFNLGHGVLPGTDPQKVKDLVQLIHDLGPT